MGHSPIAFAIAAEILLAQFRYRQAEEHEWRAQWDIDHGWIESCELHRARATALVRMADSLNRRFGLWSTGDQQWSERFW